MKRADFLKGALYLALATRAPLAWGQEEGQYGVETDLPAIDGEPQNNRPRDPHRGAVTNLPIPRYVSLKGNEGNARRGPGLTHRIDWVFTKPGMPLRITAEHEHWRRVEDNEGMGGWVHYALLSGVRTVLVTTDMAEFHATSDPTSQVAYQAELGVVGKLLECNSNWCRISVEGEKGWIEKTSLWGVDPDELVN